MYASVLTEREEQVLEAVVRTYIETAEPVGSRRLAKRFALGVSPATIRNTMADLEEKAFLDHPHTSAGRVPTDRGYRYYVDALMRPIRLTEAERRALEQELREGVSGALERLIRRAARALGGLTGELGVAVVPRVDEAVLESLELLAAGDEKVLLVLRLDSGVVRTIYIDLPVSVPATTLVSVAMLLNERLAGQTLTEIRRTLPQRLRDAAPGEGSAATELIRIFLRSGDRLFEWRNTVDDHVHLGHASVLANQPEFARGSDLKRLIELTERRDLLATVLGTREHDAAFRITIGAENPCPELSTFAVVTSKYRIANVHGVIGVIGPTRMAYDRVVAMVDQAGTLVSELFESAGSA